MKGGFVTLRRNELRDNIAETLEEVTSDVKVEPALLGHLIPALNVIKTKSSKNVMKLTNKKKRETQFTNFKR